MKTCDLCDANEALVRIADPVFGDFGGVIEFSGRARTLKLFEDNSLVREALATPGNDSVLVVDGGGSLRCALLGGNLAALAEKNGWAGVVIDGCVRDSAELEIAKIGIKAIATHPLKSIKRGDGQVDISIDIAGISVNTGDWVYADEDGLIVSASALSI